MRQWMRRRVKLKQYEEDMEYGVNEEQLLLLKWLTDVNAIFVR